MLRCAFIAYRFDCSYYYYYYYLRGVKCVKYINNGLAVYCYGFYSVRSTQPVCLILIHKIVSSCYTPRLNYKHVARHFKY
jgi:hypothetical protein